MTLLQQIPFPEERRWATVLFADVQGFSQLSVDLDFEEASDLMKSVWSTLDDVITRFEGHIDKHIGDGVIAVWGAPYAGENDAERAISAGLAMLEALKTFVQGSKVPEVQNLDLRIGINTGPVLAGYLGANDEYTVMGDTVYVANHLEDIAEPGKIVISESTHRHVRGEFKTQSLGPITLKGKTQPIDAFLVNRRKENTNTIRYHSEESLKTRMVGREAEINKLTVFYKRAIRFYSPMLVFVTGEAGIGKSRLLMEFTNLIDEMEPNLTLMSSRSLAQTSHDPFYLWKLMWHNRFGINEQDSPEVAREKFDAGIRKMWEVKMDGRGPAEAVHLIGSLMGMDWPASKYLAQDRSQPELRVQKAFDLTRDLLRRTCVLGPTVLVFDDLQWTDRISLELLNYLLAPGVEPFPLLILAATRKEFFRQHPRWANKAEIINLEPLPIKTHIVRQAYPDLHDLPEEVMKELIQRSDGNPYFLEEMVKDLVKSGVAKSGTKAQDIITYLRSRIPETLQALLQARLDSLTREARMVALMASVVGRVFWVGPVLAAARSASYTGTGLLTLGPSIIDRVVQDGLRRLVQAEMAFPRAGTRFSEDQEYIFKHSILRDVAYGLIPRKYLPQYHLAVARNMVVRKDTTFKVMAAHHFDQAGALYEASRHYEHAAREAQSRGANDEAQWLFARARTLKEKLANLS